jgi:hypothetical protein
LNIPQKYEFLKNDNHGNVYFFPGHQGSFITIIHYNQEGINNADHQDELLVCAELLKTEG